MMEYEDIKLLKVLTSFFSVRQMIELSFLSTRFLEKVTQIPVRLHYFKKVVEYGSLEQTFAEYFNSERITKWKVGGMYSSISELSTLFQVIRPELLEFLGIVNPHVSRISEIVKCVNLERFELHGCNKSISLSPLLELKDTLKGVSLLACSQVKDIKLLEKLPKLKILSTFKSSSIEALPDLSKLPKLELLSIGECVNVQDVSNSLLLETSSSFRPFVC